MDRLGDSGAVRSDAAGTRAVLAQAAPGIGWALAGYAALAVAFEALGRLTAQLGAAPGMIVTAGAVLTLAVGVEWLLRRGSLVEILVRLGLGRPAARALLVGVLIGLVLLALLPIILRWNGLALAPPSDWPLLLLGILLMNGIAEEVVFRGYLFRHLRGTYSFRRAVLIGMALHALAHLPVLATAGVAVWIGANLVALASFAPLAYLYERGRNTIWAPAVVHVAIDVVKIVFTVDVVATTAGLTAIAAWMGAAIVAPYLAFLLLRGAPTTTRTAAE